MFRTIFLSLVAAMLAAPIFQAPLHAEITSRDGDLVTVVESGEAYLDVGGRAEVKEKAKQEAIRKAIELAVGVHIAAQSTLKNFAVEEDVIESYSRVYIRSVREIEYSYDSLTGIGAYRGEFVIDASTMAGLAEAERALSLEKETRVQASVFLFDGEGRMLLDGGRVRQGDRFNVMVQPTSDVYAYIIGRDTSGNLLNVFPNPSLSPYENPLRAGVQYYFPPRNSTRIFEFDDVPGRENIHFLFSAAPLPDMDALFARLSAITTKTERAELAPIIQERIATRGFAVATEATSGNLQMGDAGAEQAVGEILTGSGAFVKTVVLRHEP